MAQISYFMVKAVGNAFKPELNDSDLDIAQELFEECIVHEMEDEWLPLFQGCHECHGFVYRPKSCVSQQLGACGCMVAYEMEMSQDMMVQKEAKRKLPQANLAGGNALTKCGSLSRPTRGATQRASLGYLTRAKIPPRSRVPSFMAMSNATKKRNRVPKGCTR